jgi:hypothetical protein
MTAIKPINITKITIEYENGTRIVVKEQRTPIIGKLFFDAVKDQDINWEVLEPEKDRESLGKKIKKFFEI